VRDSGTTDPAFDWENPPAKPSPTPARGWPDRYPRTTFKSSRTLAETTKWLKWALERYGKTKQTIYENEISNVRFPGCTMEWTARGERGGGVTGVFSYSVNLREVDLGRDAVGVFTEEVRFRTKKPFTVVEKFFEKGVQKSTATRNEWSVQLFLRNEDLIPGRVSWALIHAARLCGAEVPVPR